MVTVHPPVQRGRRIGKHPVVGDVVAHHLVGIDLRKVRSRSCGAERDDRDVDDVVAESAAIGPTARNEPAIAERILEGALQRVAAEDAQTVEAVGARETSRRRREVDLDQIGNEDGLEQTRDDRSTRHRPIESARLPLTE